MLRKRLLRSQSGMTLIEIMIVLAIIASLAAFIYKGVFSNFKKSQFSQTKIIMSKVTQALQLYYVDCSKYPSSLDGLTQNSGNDCPNWTQPYMDKVPKDAWGQEFVYESSGSTYSLKSLGRDGKEINSDDVEK